MSYIWTAGKLHFPQILIPIFLILYCQQPYQSANADENVVLKDLDDKWFSLIDNLGLELGINPDYARDDNDENTDFKNQLIEHIVEILPNTGEPVLNPHRITCPAPSRDSVETIEDIEARVRCLEYKIAAQNHLLTEYETAKRYDDSIFDKGGMSSTNIASRRGRSHDIRKTGSEVTASLSPMTKLMVTKMSEFNPYKDAHRNTEHFMSSEMDRKAKMALQSFETEFVLDKERQHSFPHWKKPTTYGAVTNLNTGRRSFTDTCWLSDVKSGELYYKLRYYCCNPDEKIRKQIEPEWCFQKYMTYELCCLDDYELSSDLIEKYSAQFDRKVAFVHAENKRKHGKLAQYESEIAPLLANVIEKTRKNDVSSTNQKELVVDKVEMITGAAGKAAELQALFTFKKYLGEFSDDDAKNVRYTHPNPVSRIPDDVLSVQDFSLSIEQESFNNLENDFMVKLGYRSKVESDRKENGFDAREVIGEMVEELFQISNSTAKLPDSNTEASISKSRDNSFNYKHFASLPLDKIKTLRALKANELGELGFEAMAESITDPCNDYHFHRLRHEVLYYLETGDWRVGAIGWTSRILEHVQKDFTIVLQICAPAALMAMLLYTMMTTLHDKELLGYSMLNKQTVRRKRRQNWLVWQRQLIEEQTKMEGSKLRPKSAHLSGVEAAAESLFSLNNTQDILDLEENHKTFINRVDHVMRLNTRKKLAKQGMGQDEITRLLGPISAEEQGIIDSYKEDYNSTSDKQFIKIVNATANVSSTSWNADTDRTLHGYFLFKYYST